MKPRLKSLTTYVKNINENITSIYELNISFFWFTAQGIFKNVFFHRNPKTHILAVEYKRCCKILFYVRCLTNFIYECVYFRELDKLMFARIFLFSPNYML